MLSGTPMRARHVWTRVTAPGMSASSLVTRRTMNRACAYLWGAGAVVVMSSVPLGLPPGSNTLGVLGIAALATLVATILRLGDDRIPKAALPGFVGLGSMAITLLMWFDASPVSPYALIYIWAALYAFYFFSILNASIQVVLMGGLAAAEIAAHGTPSPGAPHWMLIMSTVIVAGIWVRQLVHQVGRRATLDGLTGAANRLQLDDELPRILERARRTGEPVTVAMLDLDNFKAYNDERGHLAGDDQLRHTTTAWLRQLRGTDLLIRYGGEEFVVVLADCEIDAAVDVVERIRMATPNGQTCSAGVAVWDGHESPPMLVGRADAALYEAKRTGRDRIALASGTPGPSGVIPTDWAAYLHTVVAEGRARSMFQPIVWLENQRRHAVEALARFDDLPVGASVEDVFSTAQRIGLAQELDGLSRRAAVAGASRLGEAEVIFINVSLGALLSPLQTVDQLLLTLESVGRRPETIVLEITEREVVRDPELLGEVLATYRAEGFRFALDDVGEGLSSLLLMATTCPEYIKLARSTVVTLDQLGSRAAARAVIAFAATTGTMVIGEGIETTAQAEQLAALGVQLGQGYLLGRPAWPEEISVSPAAGPRRIRVAEGARQRAG